MNERHAWRFYSGLSRVVLVRVFVAALGTAAVAWGSITISIFSQQATIETIAHHIVSGDTYKIDVLLRQLSVVEAVEKSAYCRARAVSSAAIIRLRLVEDANRDAKRKSVDSQKTRELDDSIRRSLSCTPADPFLWLVLYWEGVHNGFKRGYLKYLELSYRFGANEGWIALKRNPLAFANYESLPTNVTTDVINEFLALINSGLYDPAVAILRGPAWRLQNILLPHLARLPLRQREIFATIAYYRGLTITVPGVTPLDSRPFWKRGQYH
jgi:hypothetical protein